MLMNTKDYTNEAVSLLRRLISTPSVSRDEAAAADIMEEYMQELSGSLHRKGNNLWIVCDDYTPERKTLLLNAHIDTVRPVASWTRDPFTPTLEGDRLYGLGSNDCGGGLMALLQVYRIMTQPGAQRDYNLIYLCSAEEEVSGANGISSVIPDLPAIDLAIVGEPTAMQPAVAEKGLMVVDVTVSGKSGHAARGEGVNAIYEALDDLRWFKEYRFDKVSPLLGPTLMTVTVISAGTQHNVVPDKCVLTVDVRTNELYTNEEVFDIIYNNVKGEAKARSFRLHSSGIPMDHPVVQRCLALGMTPFGSPTLSDQALMPWPSIKLGPGNSARSHSADEYICLSEIEKAIEQYCEILAS